MKSFGGFEVGRGGGSAGTPMNREGPSSRPRNFFKSFKQLEFKSESSSLIFERIHKSKNQTVNSYFSLNFLTT